MMSIFHRLTMQQRAGMVILLCLAVFAFCAPLAGTDPDTQDLHHAFAAPGAEHLLGTDHFGRDMLARLSGGMRISFALAIICVFSAAVSGVACGLAAAWYRRWLDTGLNFLANTILALPGLVLILVFAAIVPGSFLMIYIAISLVLWVEFFRLVRAITLPVVQGEELESSALLGFGKWYLLKRHIWPAIAADVYSLSAFGAATSVIAMSSTGFVYVGLKPPTPELGLMIVELFPYYYKAPWLLMEPIAALFLMVFAFQLLAGKQS